MKILLIFSFLVLSACSRYGDSNHITSGSLKSTLPISRQKEKDQIVKVIVVDWLRRISSTNHLVLVDDAVGFRPGAHIHDNSSVVAAERGLSSAIILKSIGKLEIGKEKATALVKTDYTLAGYGSMSGLLESVTLAHDSEGVWHVIDVKDKIVEDYDVAAPEPSLPEWNNLIFTRQP